MGEGDRERCLNQALQLPRHIFDALPEVCPERECESEREREREQEREQETERGGGRKRERVRHL